MRTIRRTLETSLLNASKEYPAVVLTGPRRTGKTFLLRTFFPKHHYYLLEDPDILDRIKHDIRGFLESVELPAIFDEIQNAPELFPFLRTRIDESLFHAATSKKKTKLMGQWLFTGSHEAPLMRQVTESMAGRAALLSLLPFSYEESDKASLIRGGFPEVALSTRSPSLWFSSYLQTYIERDIRALAQIRNLSIFRKFLRVLASRHGQVLNKTDIASPLGISVPTISEWLHLLEITSHILLVPPFYENFGKRLIKSPKIYFLDSGLVVHLLGITSMKALELSPFKGAVFEGAVAAEISKYQLHRGRQRELYYFRDQQGLEVDFIIPEEDRNLLLVECKATKTPLPSMTKPLQSLQASASAKTTRGLVVHQGGETNPKFLTLAPNTLAVPLASLHQHLR
jgi:uncharacterized protein